MQASLVTPRKYLWSRELGGEWRWDLQNTVFNNYLLLMDATGLAMEAAMWVQLFQKLQQKHFIVSVRESKIHLK